MDVQKSRELTRELIGLTVWLTVYWKRRRTVTISPLVQSRWSWGGLAFLVVGGVAAFTMPSPLGALLAILGLVVCAATVAGEVMLTRYTESEGSRLRRPFPEENEGVRDKLAEPLKPSTPADLSTVEASIIRLATFRRKKRRFLEQERRGQRQAE